MRYERKYRIEGPDIFAVRAIVDGLPVSFRKLHPDRQVNNVYLDTRDFSYFRENLSGVGQRRKYRVRWYGTDLEHVARPVLELKIKDGELGEKFSEKLPDFALGSYADIQNVLRASLLALSRRPAADPSGLHPSGSGQDSVQAAPRHPLPLHDLVPTLVNSYLRSYLISNDGRFRLTLDREMRFYRVGTQFQANRNPAAIGFVPDEAVILEVKYESENDHFFPEIGQRLPFRLGKNSKYVNGMMLVGNV